MDFGWILSLFLEVFLIKKTSKIKKAILGKSLKTWRKTLLFEGLGHALTGQNPLKNGFQNGMHVGRHV